MTKILDLFGGIKKFMGFTPEKKHQNLDSYRMFDRKRFIKDLDDGLFRDKFFFGESDSEDKKWNLVDFFEDPNAAFIGACGEGKSVNSAWTVGTYFAANSDQTLIFITDIIKGALDYEPFFKYPNVYRAVNEKDVYDPLDRCKKFIDLVYSELMSRIDLFKESGSCNLLSYEKSSGKKMPRILMVFEEFHMIPDAIEFEKNMNDKDSIAYKLKTILRAGRSTGVFVILITQKATKEHMPPHILSNITNKMISSRVSPSESQILLGIDDTSKKREKNVYLSEGSKIHVYPNFKLYGDGDPYQNFVDSLKSLCARCYSPLRAQCSYITDDKLKSVVE